MPESNYRQAVEQMLLDEATCEKCKAMNRPGAHVLERQDDPSGPLLVCSVCGHSQDFPKVTIH